MTAKYDNRRFRTLADITIPAGTLLLPTPQGGLTAMAPDGTLTVEVHSLEEAQTSGVVRQLAEGEA